MAKQAESRLQLRIKKRLKKEFKGSWWFKHWAGPFSQAGIPDLVGTVNGLFFGLEVKTKSKKSKVSRIQILTIRDIRYAGGYARIIKSEDEAVEFVRGVTSRVAIVTKKKNQYKTKTCTSCQSTYTPTTGRQWYCPTCGLSIRKDQQRIINYKSAVKRGRIKKPGVGKGGNAAKDSESPHWKGGVSLPRARKRYRKDYCERCDNTLRLEMHHKDRDQKNNDPSNLETLCKSCHKKEHINAKAMASTRKSVSLGEGQERSSALRRAANRKNVYNLSPIKQTRREAHQLKYG